MFKKVQYSKKVGGGHIDPRINSISQWARLNRVNQPNITYFVSWAGTGVHI